MTQIIVEKNGSYYSLVSDLNNQENWVYKHFNDETTNVTTYHEISTYMLENTTYSIKNSDDSNKIIIFEKTRINEHKLGNVCNHDIINILKQIMCNETRKYVRGQPIFEEFTFLNDDKNVLKFKIKIYIKQLGKHCFVSHSEYYLNTILNFSLYLNEIDTQKMTLLSKDTKNNLNILFI